MNNEEKIISMLGSLTGTVNTLVTKVDKLEAGQAKLEAWQAKLGQSTDRLQDSIARIEIEHGHKLGALLDGYALLYDMAERNTAAIERIEERLDTAEISIRVFDSKLRTV